MPVDERRLRAECAYNAQGPLQSILADVDQIGRICDASSGHRRKLRRWSLVCLIAAVVLFIAALIADIAALLPLALLALLGCIALFIYSFLYSNKLLGHRNRLDLVKQRLAIIRQDAQAGAPFSIRFSLASNPQLMSEAPWPVRRNGKQQFFQETWIAIEGPLLDGTTLSEEVTELSRKRTYSNPRGKRKTKTRRRYLLTLRFAYPQDVYGDARAAQGALNENLRVPSSAAIRGMRVTEKAIQVKGLVQSDEGIAQTANTLALGAYRILNLARRAAASQRGDAA